MRIVTRIDRDHTRTMFQGTRQQQNMRISSRNIKFEVIWWLENSHHIPMDIIRYILTEWSIYEPIETNEKFRECISLWFESQSEARQAMITRYGHISDWNTTLITNMSFAFFHREEFQEDLSAWNVQQVTNMSYMFAHCERFNCDLSTWKVMNVRDMSYMFYHCPSFHSDLSSWNVTNVQDMSYMFTRCTHFHSDISQWEVKHCQNMNYMFDSCHNFHSDISQWDVSNVRDMTGMFMNCQQFLCDLSHWNLQNIIVISMDMFYGCNSLKANHNLWTQIKQHFIQNNNNNNTNNDTNSIKNKPNNLTKQR